MDIRRTAKQFLIAVMAQGVSLAASLAISLLVPKVLDVTAFGYWQLFIFYTSYSGFFHFGLNDGVYLIEGGKRRDEIKKRTINSCFAIGGVVQLVVAATVVTIACLMPLEPDRSLIICAFAAYTVVYNMSLYLGYVFQAVNETKLYSYMVVMERLFFLVAIVLLFAFKAGDFKLYIDFFLAARIIAFAYALWHGRDIVRSGLDCSILAVRRYVAYVRVGFGLMVANIADILILGVARALVDNAWGIEAFGKVSLSLSMVNFFILFVSQASMVLFPALRQGSDEERRSFYRGIRDMMELAFPGIYLLYFPMAAILPLWLPQYADSMRYLALLIPVCVFNTKMDVCCTTYFKVLREERVLLCVNLAAVAGSMVLSLAGVYVFGSLEAVLIGAVACIVARSLWSERHLDRSLEVPSSVIPLEEVALTVAFIALTFLSSTWVAVIGYALLFVAYLFVNRSVTFSLLERTRRALLRR